MELPKKLKNLNKKDMLYHGRVKNLKNNKKMDNKKCSNNLQNHLIKVAAMMIPKVMNHKVMTKRKRKTKTKIKKKVEVKIRTEARKIKIKIEIVIEKITNIKK
jgi:hypothetical protein